VTRTRADVAVVGSGCIGLSAALACADAGCNVTLFADVRSGESTPAAGGILDASHGFSHRDVRACMRHAHDAWPTWLSSLQERTGVSVPINRLGVLDLATSVHEADRMRDLADSSSRWIEADQLTTLEPHLAHALGALHHEADATVNPLILLKALRQAVGRHRRVRVIQIAVTELLVTREVPTAVRLVLRDGTSVSASRIVLATGAWANALTGLPRALPVAPLRGQLMSVASKALRHTVMLGHGYAIPRGDGRTIIGVDDADAGFDAQHTTDGAARVRALAAAILPTLGSAGMLSTWAGLRPMTPDGLPLIGADAEFPSLIYAVGHGRNGLLLTPLTASLVAAHVLGATDVTASNLFSPARFNA
jgi:glycine oxidase